ncbi:PTS sugar transporter subunit IIA [Helcococcus ovis]|uniref:BglG family transcription antiterminator n=1 Tax=Helcococcus ovis TaxID=72026 RepID=UPI0038BD3421
MNKRQIMILQTIKLKDEYITAKSMSEIFGVSTKTIYKDIDKINEYIKQYDIKIEKLPRKGIKINDKYQIKKLFSILSNLDFNKNNDNKSIEFREEYLFKEILLNRKKLNIFDYEDNAYLSEGSARRDIKKFEKYLISKKIYLEKENGRFYVTGDEVNIRKTIKEYLYALIDNSNFEDIKTLSRFYNIETIYNCKNVINELGRKYNYSLSKRYFNTLLIDLLVQIHMIELGFILYDYKISLNFDINHFEVYFYAREILTKILNLKEEIPSQEIEALSYTLLAVGFEINSIGYNSRLYKSVIALIKKVSNILDIDLTQDEHLKDMLISHVGPMIFRLKKSISVINPVVEEVKKQYSVLYNVIWLSVRELTDEFNIKMTDDEAAFLAIHFQIAVEKVHKSINILVICPHGISTSELIVSKLNRIILGTDKVIKADFDDLDKIKFNNIDFIVSSVKLNNLKIPIFEVSPVITDEEMKNIRIFYNNLDKNRLTKSNEKIETNKNLIRELLEENILLNSKAKNKEQVFEEIIKISNKLNQKDSQFLDSIKKRENMGSTSVYTGISIPHCDPKHVARSQLGIITLDKPIEWGKNLIKVVLLIAISDHDINSTKDILINIYRKIENRNFIDKISSSKTKEELISTFINWREDYV